MTTNQANRLRELCRLPDLTREQAEELQVLAVYALIDGEKALDACRATVALHHGIRRCDGERAVAPVTLFDAALFAAEKALANT